MKKQVLLLSLVISPFAFSGEIIVNDDIELLAINGTKVSSSILNNDANHIEVPDGPNQVVVKYLNSFRNSETIDSKPYIFTIDVDGDTTITTDTFRNVIQAKERINKGLNWYLENGKGKSPIQSATLLKGEGFMPYSDIEELIATYNSQNNTGAYIAPSNTVKNIYQVPSNAAIYTTPSNNSLIETYKASTREQKKQFKMWLIENETK